ncbi:UPF0449 protein C19orf25 homolog [Copidosoma floridanum]|uniref:UPF0449 protein C19orf25 homolog n=1 Tax=Copidosoma floridanum TaxID=29053 RepID=UPI0006C93E15|nr:UPF0449 protein C19orf25 homolog [Copidosoma floridanum]
MFGNKKHTLPPRPKPPGVDELLEDLDNSRNKDDVAFKLLARESAYHDSPESLEMNELNNVYEKVKTYLDVHKKLQVVKDSISDSGEQLETSVNDMLKKTEEIKVQAQAALIQ